MFEDEAAHVPAWMFLSWIPQLLGTLDSDEGAQVVATLETIAREYPSAMYHPFQVTLASLATETGQCGHAEALVRVGEHIAVLGDHAVSHVS